MQPTLIIDVRSTRQKCATAKVDDPDTWYIRGGLNENVVRLDVPVKHPFGMDLNKSIHQLFYDDLWERERDM